MVTEGCSVLGGGFASHAFRGLLAIGCWLLAAGCCPCLFVCLKVSVFVKMRVGSGQTCMWDRSMAAVGMPESFTNVEFVYMCVCVCVRACAQSKMRTYTHASTHTHMHIHVHMRAHVHTCEHRIPCMLRDANKGQLFFCVCYAMLTEATCDPFVPPTIMIAATYNQAP